MNRTSTTVTTTANDGRTVKMSSAQADTIEALTNTRKGGCGSVKGYIPSSGWVKSPVQNMQIITHFSTENLYKRRMAALEKVEFADIMDDVSKDDEFGNDMAMAEVIKLFIQKKNEMIETLQKSLDGNRDDARREAHDTCYAKIGDVKVHLVTEGKPKVPVVDNNGAVEVASIMIPYLQLSKKVIVEGERKVVKSRAPTRMKNIIEKQLNSRSVDYRTLSLKADNFESFTVDRQTFVKEDVTKFGDIISE
jgi:hypothetical protein